jgi:hypothetical protein
LNPFRFFTGALEWIAKAYPEAKTMAHVAQDDLIDIEGATYTYAGAKANNIKMVYDKFFSLKPRILLPLSVPFWPKSLTSSILDVPMWSTWI